MRLLLSAAGTGWFLLNGGRALVLQDKKVLVGTVVPGHECARCQWGGHLEWLTQAVLRYVHVTI